MTIVDLTSMAKPEEKQQDRVNVIVKALNEDVPGDCYQCGKCTSGCEAFILLELEPHKVMALSKSGFIDELLNSKVLWTCVTCMKCKERCPQNLAPVDVIFALKNVAVASGKQIHTGYSNMLQAVLGTGYIQKPKEVVGRENDTATRDGLGLPPLPQPKDMQKLQQALMKAATETLR